MGLTCLHTSIFIKTPSLERLQSKAKVDLSPDELRLSPAHQPSISWSRGTYYQQTANIPLPITVLVVSFWLVANVLPLVPIGNDKLSSSMSAYFYCPTLIIIIIIIVLLLSCYNYNYDHIIIILLLLSYSWCYYYNYY